MGLITVTQEIYLLGVGTMRAYFRTDDEHLDGLVDGYPASEIIVGMASVNEALLKMLLELKPEETVDSLLDSLVDDALKLPSADIPGDD